MPASRRLWPGGSRRPDPGVGKTASLLAGSAGERNPLKLAVVIAAYDEFENIRPLCGRLLATLRGQPAVTFELIFVVEGNDGTAAALRELAATAPEIRIIEPPRARGLGAAFRLGFAAVAGDADRVVTMDADLNHAPEDIPRLLATLDARKADIVVGSRLVDGGSIIGMPTWKRLLSRSVNELIRRLFATGVRDQTSGFRAYRAPALRGLAFANDGFAFLPEILTLATARGYRVVEEPITFVFRKHGESKMRISPTAASYAAYFAVHWRRAGRRRRRRSPGERG
jgi:dolichol-phosphate mannosyltransferase